MREIKFRVWDSQQKRMYRVSQIHWDELGMKFWKWTGIEMAKSLGDALMQYTGRKDKNGKEIYEGDIVNFIREYSTKPEQGSIQYVWAEFGIRFMEQDGEILQYPISSCKYIEAIGNIYENPELQVPQ